MAKFILTPHQKITVHARAEEGMRRILDGDGVCVKNNMKDMRGRWLNDYRPKKSDLIHFIEFKEWVRGEFEVEEAPEAVIKYFQKRHQAQTVYSADLNKLQYAIRIMDTVDALRSARKVSKIDFKSVSQALHDVFNSEADDQYKRLLLEAFSGRDFKDLTAREKAALPHILFKVFDKN